MKIGGRRVEHEMRSNEKRRDIPLEATRDSGNILVQCLLGVSCGALKGALVLAGMERRWGHLCMNN